MKKVIIIGKGVGWKLAPASGETWGVNDLCLRRPVKVVFDLHDETNQLREKIRGKAKELGSELITLENFPFDAMHCDYFSNSIAYMIAYALHLGYEEIDLFGCVLWGGSEYNYQKPCVEYWIGYARGKGVKVNINGNTNLLRTETGKVYGYDISQKGFK